MASLTRKINAYFPKKLIVILTIVLLTIWYNLGTLPGEKEFVYQKFVTQRQAKTPERITGGRKDESLKYILNWTPSHYDFLKSDSQTDFIESNCTYTNCYLTNNKSYLKDLRDFDALLFSTIQLSINEELPDNLPSIRSESQKYIAAGIEPAPWLPIKNPRYNNFFNWTWTYRLDSDILWRYLVIQGRDGEIGPRVDTKWLYDYLPITESVRRMLRFKNKAVAWIVSHCHTKSKREVYVYELRKALNKYNLTVDVFGDCGVRCGHHATCLRKVKREYYFYLALEHTCDRDYVTEKLLLPTTNYAVPIVLGGADYSRFLPPNSYLNAKELNPEEMAAKMYEIISNTTHYQQFFRWTYHYSYKWGLKSEICNLCEALNNKQLMKKRTVYNNFSKWWLDTTDVDDFIQPKIEMDKEFLDFIKEFKFTRRANKKLIRFIKKRYFKKPMLSWENGTLTHYVMEALKILSRVRGIKRTNYYTRSNFIKTRLRTNRTQYLE